MSKLSNIPTPQHTHAFCHLPVSLCIVPHQATAQNTLKSLLSTRPICHPASWKPEQQEEETGVISCDAATWLLCLFFLFLKRCLLQSTGEVLVVWAGSPDHWQQAFSATPMQSGTKLCTYPETVTELWMWCYCWNSVLWRAQDCTETSCSQGCAKASSCLLDIAGAVWRLGERGRAPLLLLVAALRYSKGQQEHCIFSQH